MVGRPGGLMVGLVGETNALTGPNWRAKAQLSCRIWQHFQMETNKSSNRNKIVISKQLIKKQ